MSSRTYNDPEIGPVRLVKNARARRISVRVHPLKGVTVTVPRFCSYAAGLQVFGQYRGWVLKTLEKQKSLRETAAASAAAPEQIEAMRQEAKMLLPRRLSELAERYGFSYGRVFIKHNSSNWGSCSARGNINLNLNLVRLPQLLCDHVILHELCHLRHPNHGPEFHALLERLDADNLRRLAGSGEQEDAFLQLQDAIRHSRARFPIQYVLQKELKNYPLV